MIGVLHILSQVLGGLALALLVPSAIALVVDTGAAESYLLVSGLVGFLSGAVFFALRGREGRFDRPASFVLAAALWTVVPLVAALPIAIETDVGYVGALFEAVSGFTTTGATIFRSLSDVGPATIFWRAELQWLGGLAALVTFATILAPAGLGGLDARELALGGGIGVAGERRVTQALRTIAGAYALLTGICAALLFATGLPTFDALCLALSTVATGGFMPVDGNMSVYGSPFAEAVIAVFMAIGATSVVWHWILVAGRGQFLSEHRETWWVAAAMIAAGLVYALEFVRGGTGILAAVGEGLFSGISLVSGSGYATREGGMTALPDTLVIFLALAGGAALSTAGGIKLYRIGAMMAQSGRELQRLIFPHIVRGTRSGTRPHDGAFMVSLWANLAAVTAVIAASALLLALSLPAFDAAMIAALAAFSNAGPLYSPEWLGGSAWPAYADFNTFSQLVTIATMILGRVEVIVLFAAVNAAYWRF